MACVREARERGQLRPHLDDRPVARTAWAVVHGLATLHLDHVLKATDPDVSPYQLGRTAIELLIDGLRVRPAPGSAPGSGTGGR